jgi:hypothetical protein
VRQHIRYPRGSECQCAACDRFFTSPSGFSFHQWWRGKGSGSVLGVPIRPRSAWCPESGQEASRGLCRTGTPTRQRLRPSNRPFASAYLGKKPRTGPTT